MLRRAGLHAHVQFDSVAPEHNAEQRLYAALWTLQSSAEPALRKLLESRQRDAARRRQQSLRLIAGCLLQVAAKRNVTRLQPSEEQQAIAELTDWVRGREYALIQSLLAVFRFDAAALNAPKLPLIGGRFESDLFAFEALKQLGGRLSAGAASGAALGAGVDLMLAGISLGAAAGIGAALGAGVQAGRHYGGRLLGRLRQRYELTVDDRVLQHLAGRALGLLQALEGRGHGAVQPIETPQTGADRLWSGRLPAALRAARAHPEWSGLSFEDEATENDEFQRRRLQLSDELSQLSLPAAGMMAPS